LKFDLLEPDPDAQLPAGEFGAWLGGMSRALDGGTGSVVPCGDCNACCRGAYFIHVQPHEADSLAAIPEALVFPAPGRPTGHRVLGFDEHGRCPMLVDEGCSIYEARPATCRTYDCRVFAATGLAEPGSDKAAIMARARRWRFSYADESAARAHAALMEGARFLAQSSEAFGDLLPTNVTQLAMLAVRLHEVLVEHRGEITVERLRAALF
jgi:Fe-S-cluster containining protein